MLHSVTYSGSSFSPELWRFMLMFWSRKLHCTLHMHVRPINEPPLHPIFYIYVYGLRRPWKPTFTSVQCVLTITFSPCTRRPCSFVAFSPVSIFEYSYSLILLQCRPGMAMVPLLENLLPDPLRGSPIAALIYSCLLPPFPSRVCSCCSHHRGQI